MSAAVPVVPVVVSVLTGLWVFTAIPVGDLCGASAMSEVILFRDRRKLFGIWVAIVVSMLACTNPIRSGDGPEGTLQMVVRCRVAGRAILGLAEPAPTRK